nr:MAG: ORF1 [Torque teno midi virus]
MPFYWRRRKRTWYPYRRFGYKTRYRTRRRRRRIHKRQRSRRPYRRRRRRRRYKVKKKRQTITLKQWQPDSITTCKIKGSGTIVLGADGRQYRCYTNNKLENTNPKAPCGGGFGVESYSLKYLYSEYKMGNNIWTKTNFYKDLCRYLRVRFTFYRHPHTDFIVQYDRQPPFDLDKLTYPSTHPKSLLLARHKKFIISKFTNPNGKIKTRLTIKPPKQMINKWFFTEQFSTFPLVLIRAAAINLSYSNLGCCNENQMVTIIYLNPGFYQNGNWGITNTTTTYYKPWDTAPLTFKYSYMVKDTLTTGQLTIQPTLATSRTHGWFTATFLQATEITDPKQATLPTGAARYNPNRDDGRHSKVWLVSSLKKDHTKPKDEDLFIEGIPLYQALYGFLDYVKQKKSDPTFLNSYYIVLQSQAIFPSSTIGTDTYYIPIDLAFWQGKNSFDQYITLKDETFWVPLLQHQIQTINDIVESGPYIPKLNNNRDSTWELNYTYSFLFKWGGPQVTDPVIEDPSKLKTYPVPDKYYGKIQIQNPEKQKTDSFLHPWDYRRGLIKPSALKRMYENLSTDSDFQESQAETPKKFRRIGPELQATPQKNKEIKACLQALCKSTTSQETEEDLHQLIQHQQQQQRHLKHNILKLLTYLKEKQNMLQLNTGIYN